MICASSFFKEAIGLISLFLFVTSCSNRNINSDLAGIYEGGLSIAIEGGRSFYIDNVVADIRAEDEVLTIDYRCADPDCDYQSSSGSMPNTGLQLPTMSFIIGERIEEVNRFGDLDVRVELSPLEIGDFELFASTPNINWVIIENTSQPPNKALYFNIVNRVDSDSIFELFPNLIKF